MSVVGSACDAPGVDHLQEQSKIGQVICHPARIARPEPSAQPKVTHGLSTLCAFPGRFRLVSDPDVAAATCSTAMPSSGTNGFRN